MPPKQGTWVLECGIDAYHDSSSSCMCDIIGVSLKSVQRTTHALDAMSIFLQYLLWC